MLKYLVLIFFFIMVTTLEVVATCPDNQRVKDSYLVITQKNTHLSQKPQEDFDDFIRRAGGISEVLIHKSGSSSSLNLKAKNDTEINHVIINKKLVNIIKNRSDVISVEQDCRYKIFSETQDPFLERQNFHEQVSSFQAWSLSPGIHRVVVAVIDTGVDYNHEDLQGNMWINRVEQNGVAGVDDDQNGCVDDIYGCDVADNDGNPMPGSSPIRQHGTHIAGLISATSNNGLGGAGVFPHAKIMVIKGFENSESGAKLSTLIKGIKYAVDNGAHIINCSWGAKKKPGMAELEAFQYAIDRGVLPVVASGNAFEGAEEYTPASLPGVLTVGSVNSKNQVSLFSNHGDVVKIYAPGGELESNGRKGEALLSTFPEDMGLYGRARGTSMAAPIVSGLAAYLLSFNDQLKPRELIELIQLGSQSRDVDTQIHSSGEIKIVNFEKTISLVFTKKEAGCSEERQCKNSLSTNSSNLESPTLPSWGCNQGYGTRQSSLPFFFLIIPMLICLLVRGRNILASAKFKEVD